MKRLFLCVFVAVALMATSVSAADFTPVPDQAIPDQVAVPDQVALDCAPRVRTVTRTVTRTRTVRCPEPCAPVRCAMPMPCGPVRFQPLCPPVRCRCRACEKPCPPKPCRPVTVRVRCCPPPPPACTPCEPVCRPPRARAAARAFAQATIVAAQAVRCPCRRCCPCPEEAPELPALTPQPQPMEPTPAVR